MNTYDHKTNFERELYKIEQVKVQIAFVLGKYMHYHVSCNDF